jgi:hypothetical protein
MKERLRNSFRLQSEQIFSFGELKRTMGTLTGHGTLLEPNSASVIVKQSLMNHGLMRNVQN